MDKKPEKFPWRMLRAGGRDHVELRKQQLIQGGLEKRKLTLLERLKSRKKNKQ